MKRVLVLGAGVGGVATAVALRKRLDPADEILLIDRRTSFVMGPRKNWSVAGSASLDDGERDILALVDRGITVRKGQVNEIFPAQCAVEVDVDRIEGDAMVIALGAAQHPTAIPGFGEHAINYYDPRRTAEAAAAIAAFRGGRLVIGIFGVPHPCAYAPYELALTLVDRLGRERVPAEVTLFTPHYAPLPILGPQASGAIAARLAEAGIDFRPQTIAGSVEPGLVVAGSTSIPFDLLIGVPPYRMPPVVAASGLAHGSLWLHVNPETLETEVPNVYAVGDITGITLKNGMQLPKWGTVAHAEADIVAARIADTFAGRTPGAVFSGEGTLYMEMGGGLGAAVTGNFYADPPDVRLSDPSPAHVAAKQAFESDRLTAWFGG